MNNYSQNIDFFARKLSGELSQNELVDFTAWLEASSENMEEFAAFQKLWDGVGVVAHSKPFDKNKAWSRFEKQVNSNVTKKFNLAPIYSAAAIVVLGLFSWVFFELFSPTHPNISDFATLSAESKTIILSDSSKVILNENSKIQYPESYANTKQRIVKLKGEAFFEVSHNAQQPFVVQVNNNRVEVRGTSFYVEEDSISGNVTVIVKTGKVAIYKDGGVDTVLLTKGQQGVLKAQSLIPILSTTANQNSVSWRTKKFNFVQQSLQTIISSINQAYYSDISIPESSLAQEEFDVNFEGKTYEEVVAILEMTAGVSFKTVNGNEIIVRDKN